MSLVDNPKRQYSISVAEFTNQDMLANFDKHYRVGNVVTRDRWAAFMVEGFRISQGILNAHQLYMLFAHLNTGFQITQTIANYEIAGGWNSLYDSERSFISGAYLKAKSQGAEHKLLDESFGGRLDAQIARLKSTDYSLERMNSILGYGQLTLEDFRKLKESSLKRYIARRVREINKTSSFPTGI